MLSPFVEFIRNGITVCRINLHGRAENFASFKYPTEKRRQDAKEKNDEEKISWKTEKEEAAPS